MINIPTVSVIVPVFNTAERLPQCLDSLLNQTLADLEIILIDDGSTDGSLSICRHYARANPERIKILTGPHGGVGTARNRGLAAAGGEWLAFCDSDDRVHPELYQLLYDNAVRDGADLSSCALRDIGPREVKTVTTFPFTGAILITDNQTLLDNISFPLLYSSRRVHGYLCIHLFKRSLVEKYRIRFVPGLSMKEDELFLLEYLLRTAVMTAVDTPLYDYLRFERSACTRYYRIRTDYFRERNWWLRAKAQLRIAETGGLYRLRPALKADLTLRKYLHEAQMHCCTPSIPRARLRLRLRALARRARANGIRCRTPGMIFWVFLYYLPTFLPFLCRMKRLWDALRRQLDRAEKFAAARTAAPDSSDGRRPNI